MSPDVCMYGSAPEQVNMYVYFCMSVFPSMSARVYVCIYVCMYVCCFSLFILLTTKHSLEIWTRTNKGVLHIRFPYQSSLCMYVCMYFTVHPPEN